MKTLFIVLVSSVVLAGCVKPQGATVDDEKTEPPEVVKAIGDFCKGKNAVLVVYVKRNGKAERKACPGITLKENLPAGVDEKVTDTDFSLGLTQKWKMKRDPDPCIEWSVGGYSNYYCW